MKNTKRNFSFVQQNLILRRPVGFTRILENQFKFDHEFEELKTRGTGNYYFNLQESATSSTDSQDLDDDVVARNNKYMDNV